MVLWFLRGMIVIWLDRFVFLVILFNNSVVWILSLDGFIKVDVFDVR